MTDVQVALNLIRAETIRKERKNARLNETFRLNPKNLVNSMVTGKPNEDLQKFGESSGASHDIMGLFALNVHFFTSESLSRRGVGQDNQRDSQGSD